MSSVNTMIDLYKLNVEGEYKKPNLSPIDIDIESNIEFDVEEIQLPIFKAIYKNDYETIKKYINADYIERNLNHQTPLMLAVKLNKIEFVELLLNESCQIDDNDNIALDFAKKYNVDIIIKQMLEMYELYE